MIRGIILTAFFSTLLAGCIRRTPGDAHTLVKASSFATISKLGISSGIFPRERDRQSEDYKKFTACINSYDELELEKVFTDIFESYLSATEINDALKFYQGEIGKRLVKYETDQARFLAGLSPKQPLPLSTSDSNVVDEFDSSPVGRKIRTEVFFSQPEIARKVSVASMKAAEFCAKHSF